MIAFHFDENFSRWGKLLVKSIAKNAPDENTIIFGVNLEWDTVVELRDLHKNTHIMNYYLYFDGEQKRYDGDKGQAEWKILMQNLRTYFIPKLVEHTIPNELVIYMDADMLVRQPLSDIYKRMNGFDVGLYSEKHKYKAGLMVFRVGSRNYSIFCNQYNQINHNGKLYHIGNKLIKICTKHYKDQNCLKGIARQLSKVCNINLWSLHYNINTPLWSAHKGDKEKAYKAFVKESNKCCQQD